MYYIYLSIYPDFGCVCVSLISYNSHHNSRAQNRETVPACQRRGANSGHFFIYYSRTEVLEHEHVVVENRVGRGEQLFIYLSGSVCIYTIRAPSIDLSIMIYFHRHYSRTEVLEHEHVVVEGGVGRSEQLVTGEDGVCAGHEHDRLLEWREGHAAGRQAHLGRKNSSLCIYVYIYTHTHIYI